MSVELVYYHAGSNPDFAKAYQTAFSHVHELNRYQLRWIFPNKHKTEYISDVTADQFVYVEPPEVPVTLSDGYYVEAASNRVRLKKDGVWHFWHLGNWKESEVTDSSLISPMLLDSEADFQ